MSATERIITPIIACVLLCTAGCGPVSTVPLDSALDTPRSEMFAGSFWAYARTLELQVTDYSKRRFGSYPEGLRKALNRHREAFFKTGQLSGTIPDQQSYLFFEYRRHKAMGKVNQPAAPDKETEKYLHALVDSIDYGVNEYQRSLGRKR